MRQWSESSSARKTLERNAGRACIRQGWCESAARRAEERPAAADATARDDVAAYDPRAPVVQRLLSGGLPLAAVGARRCGSKRGGGHGGLVCGGRLVPPSARAADSSHGDRPEEKRQHRREPRRV